MTGFLGYDNDRLLNLRSAMDRALLELSDLHISDPAANATLQLVRRAHLAIADRCRPPLQALLSCQATTAYVPARLQRNDIAVARLENLQQTQGWSVVTDPLVPRPQSMTIEDARALGWALSQTHLKSLTKNAEISWLATNLAEIAQRPELAAALVANMTADAWKRLCNQLGDDRITLLSTLTVEYRLSDDDRSHLASIDAVFAHLGSRRGSERDVCDTNSSENLSSVVDILYRSGCLVELERARLIALDQQQIEDDMELEEQVALIE